ncbi:branched-chain amino acid ABC transporter permease [Ferviditalea candida]|uniref:Branched-chain amino acid ABC transporter permease n=1 Tax=Ferviditalea candida TaxID=3108399 RepID=A0ABU5ZNG2_9BACL|nr:branched-chain amino acid ABC transporter permease [Paenibacillaceae bacterium T2]
MRSASKSVWTILGIALFVALPFMVSSYGVLLTTEIFIMAIFAMSLGYLMGYAGLVSLGHAAFFGIGAYTIALAGDHIANTYVLILLAVVFSGLIAWISGSLFIRTSAFYFLMITLAFGQLLYALVWQLKPITGGADGKKVSAVMDFGFGPIVDPNMMYVVTGILFLLSYLFLRKLASSPAGKVIKGVMENENRMKSLGYNIRTYKLLAYTLSGMLAGLAGALYAYYNVFVSPDLIIWLFSGQVLIMVIVGGVGTLIGPAVGAGFFLILQNYMSSYTERWPMIMGIIFITFVLLRKGGIVNLLALLGKKRSGGEADSLDREQKEAVR